jgi:hypothetical protein
MIAVGVNKNVFQVEVYQLPIKVTKVETMQAEIDHFDIEVSKVALLKDLR